MKQSSELAKEIALNLAKYADSSVEEMDSKISEIRDGTLGNYILVIE